MPTYILLSTLSPHGAGTIKANPQRVKEVNQEIEQMGAKVIQQWAVLGPYDFVNIVEAPDEKVIARVSVELAARGTAHFQTLTAIPVDEFLALLKYPHARPPRRTVTRRGACGPRGVPSCRTRA